MESHPVEFHNPIASYYELSLPGTDGEILRARYICPTSGTPAPTVLMYHDYGRGIRGWHHMTRFLALGFAVIALENRCTFLDVSTGWRAAPDGLAGAQLYTDALTIAYAAQSFPAVDSNQMITWGEGLGGALSIAVAAMVPGVIKCAALNPLPADFRSVLAQNCDGGLYAGIRAHFRNEDPLYQEADAFFSAMDFLDCTNFAALLRCPFLLGTGKMDCFSPASTQYGIAAQVNESITHLVYPKYGHERINFFEDELLKFLHF